MSKSDFSGLIVPVLTPVDERGRLDESAFVTLLHSLKERGVNGFYVTGTTGECANLFDKTWEDANRVALRELRGSGCKVYSGAVDAGTPGTIELIKRLEDMGAEYAFSTPTFYNAEGTQEQILEHFGRLVDASSLKLIVYSIEFTTHVKIRPETMAALAKMDRIVGVKDTNADWPTHFANICALRDTKMGIATVVEPIIGPALLAGADGIVTALGNFLPEPYVEILKAAKDRDLDRVQEIQERIMEYDRAMACPGENGVAKMKYIGSLLGICSPYTSMSASKVTEAQKKILSEKTVPYIRKMTEK